MLAGDVFVHEVKDACPPFEAFCRLVSNTNLFFLDSALPAKGISRYSFLGFDPFLTIKTKHRKITLTDKDGTIETEGNPFEHLRELLKQFSLTTIQKSIPFPCGAVGYLGYDLCHFVEKLPSKAVDDMGLPDMYMGFYDIVISYDHVLGKCSIVGVDFGIDNTLKDKIEQIAHVLGKKSDSTSETINHPAPLELSEPTFRFNFTKELYLGAIRQIKDYIKAGDVYQVNLSQRLETHIAIPPYKLYKRLRSVNPAPFSCYVTFDDVAIISSSPERFLQVRNRHVQTRPIKGTRPRGKDEKTDDHMRQALISSPKDDAELTMITDLERNDLGRVCNYGSVNVTEKKVLETYPTVYHLVSTVEGDLHERYDLVDLLKATFPGGSITGAPKIRAMQIIDELEPTKRGVYTGAVGYIGFNGDMDLNIAIRTFVMKGKTVYFQVGSGIVADSDEEEEYEETMHKAKALIDSLKLCNSR
ncbi:MAG: aminodeoxychorismate synthase component I [Candidatus Jettenia sp.]|uniref:aminodeoxychorismate synthase n=1 Tax=Candidatus Jettenia caeni TaxID=247490 RepID=I3IKC4_9BACT|nr:aminodeoxychorismate synthase component I [Candidatus Jettenia sp. AMX1]MBC6929933.1 aminodeoxychorismate synthase component I [Candidatus Jettenia sp.]NUN23476.1 aminodeoxychorismate synthase component I [Candidatus Jettenia caeni]KAA0248482.1 MAG: aminodeoxychorismate synthase component I [Candidatus Jettenia sp. AMX1]MCE7881613.1 aminodeoxychorismate synthase component I [Candidatus Jettenia sp. AMX1]MCQ3928235.1 aminodeoxychorismate synthase component I [Candidatus Jettenia sp.]